MMMKVRHIDHHYSTYLVVKLLWEDRILPQYQCGLLFHHEGDTDIDIDNIFYLVFDGKMNIIDLLFKQVLLMIKFVTCGKKGPMLLLQECLNFLGFTCGEFVKHSGLTFVL